MVVDYAVSLDLSQVSVVALHTHTMSDTISYLDIPLIDVSMTQDMSPNQDMSPTQEVMSPVLLVDGFVPPWSGWDCPNGDSECIELTIPDLLQLVSVVNDRCFLVD